MSKLSDQQKIDICNEYTTTNISILQLAKKFNVHSMSITSILKHRDIKINRKYIPKYNYYDNFKTIDTEEKAYWLGFILGDGSVTKNSLNVELSNIDINHLQKLRLFFGQEKLNIMATSKNCSRFTFCNKYLASDLIKLGVLPNKTYLNTLTPNIPKELLKHFYRGILDADGWITSHKNKTNTKQQHEFGFSSYNYNFLLQIQSYIVDNLELRVNGSLIERIKGNQRVCQYIIGGNNNFIKLFEHFYKDSTIYLDRKYKKALEFYNNIYIHN